MEQLKTDLPERSIQIKNNLDAIVKVILGVAKDKIAMIILFGSYAKGNWVIDLVNGYYSDLDILVVWKKTLYYSKENEISNKIEHQLKKFSTKERPIKTICEPITRLNKELEISQYFFSDIIKEGVLLYHDGESRLSKARDLSWAEHKEIAERYFNQWFSKGSGLLIDSRNALQRGDNNISVFHLHQTTESFYNGILLVLTGYKEKTHDIEKLGEYAIIFSGNKELSKVFPLDTKEKEDCFVLLKRAYIDARYDYNYHITEEQLLYLMERVEILKKMTEEICQARIGWFDEQIRKNQ